MLNETFSVIFKQCAISYIRLRLLLEHCLRHPNLTIFCFFDEDLLWIWPVSKIVKTSLQIQKCSNFWILTELVKVAMSTTATSMLLVLRLMSLKCAEVWSSFYDLYTPQVVQYQGKLCPRDIVQDRGFMTLIKRKQSWCANISFHHRERKKIHWKLAEKKDWRSQIKYTLSVHL